MVRPPSELFSAQSIIYSTKSWNEVLISTSVHAVQKADAQSVDALRYGTQYISHRIQSRRMSILCLILTVSAFFSEFPKLDDMCCLRNLPINLTYNYDMKRLQYCLSWIQVRSVRFITCHVTSCQIFLQMLYHRLGIYAFYSLTILEIATSCATSV